MESLYSVFPKELWPIEYLPDDYTGPSAGSINDIARMLNSLSNYITISLVIIITVGTKSKPIHCHGKKKIVFFVICC